MSFKALASVYGPSESESDDEPPTNQTAGLDSEGMRTEKTNGDKSGHSNESDHVHDDQVTQPPTQSGSSENAESTAMPPPPPVALLEGSYNAHGHIKRLGGPVAVSQPAIKKKKVETVRGRLFLPRQVQTQVPNVSTEDLQSYGMKPSLNMKSQ